MLDSIQKAIFEIYQEVDREVAEAGPLCEASGRCCRFKEYGHTLFLSQVEAEVLLDHAPPFQNPVSSDFCPFQKDNLCTAREPRPLGCRIYFCDPDYQETGNRITEKYLRKIKDLTLEYELGWQYAPLHVFLNNAGEQSSRVLEIETPIPTNPRTELPLVSALTSNSLKEE